MSGSHLSSSSTSRLMSASDRMAASPSLAADTYHPGNPLRLDAHQLQAISRIAHARTGSIPGHSAWRRPLDKESGRVDAHQGDGPPSPYSGRGRGGAARAA